MNQRGFSLLEAVIVAAIVAAVAAFFFNAPAGSKPDASHAAVAQFDAALAYARAYASANNGVTIAFTPNAAGGSEIDVSGAPPFVIDAEIRDKSFGAPPFSIVLNAAGHASGPGCPPGGWALSIGSGPAQVTRSIGCIP